MIRCCFAEVSRFGVDSGVRVRVLFLDFCWVGLEEGDERTEREGSTRVEGENCVSADGGGFVSDGGV